MNELKYTQEDLNRAVAEERYKIVGMIEALRDKFPNQGIEVYELQPNTEQWRVSGQAEVMIEVEKIIKRFKN